MFPPFLLWYSKSRKLQNWLHTVAAAAPAIPIPQPKIRIGSKTIFITAPVTIPTMAYAALP